MKAKDFRAEWEGDGIANELFPQLLALADNLEERLEVATGFIREVRDCDATPVSAHGDRCECIHCSAEKTLTQLRDIESKI